MHNKNLEVSQQRQIDKGEEFLIVGLEDNFQWLESELEIFINLYETKIPLKDIAHKLRRPERELIYLIIYLKSRAMSTDYQRLLRLYNRRIRKCKDDRLSTAI